MVAALNRDCDAVLCVSDAVRRLAVGYGVDAARAHVCRIGTREAEAFARTAPRGALPRADGTVTLAFLGYMRADKGFFFLLDALEALPEAVARRLRLSWRRGAATRWRWRGWRRCATGWRGSPCRWL